jgi:hypothetical protein
VHALERQFELLDRAARRIVEVADRLPIDAAIRAGREALRRAEGCSPRSEAASTAA